MKIESFNIQWHITTLCQNDCSHCYYKQYKFENSISFERQIEIIDELAIDFTKYSNNLKICFTGGDPLLFDKIYKLLEYCNIKGIKTSVLGNPQSISSESATQLKQCAIEDFQLSIDGPEEIHNQIRKSKTAFKELQEAIRILKTKDIQVSLMYTLSQNNYNYLEQTINIANGWNIDAFCFSRDIKDDYISEIPPIEYKNKLLDIYNNIILRNENSKLFLKENLWKILLYEKGIYSPPLTLPHNFIGGCCIGYSGLAIMPDGRIYPCSRIPYTIGNAAYDRVYDTFIKFAEAYKKALRKSECYSCRYLKFCRGCTAIGYIEHKKLCQKDIHCWI